MNDTPKYIDDIYFNKFSSLTGEAKLKMSIESFEIARVLALASIGSDLNEKDKKTFLLKRFYSDEKLYNEWEKKLQMKRNGDQLPKKEK